MSAIKPTPTFRPTTKPAISHHIQFITPPKLPEGGSTPGNEPGARTRRSALFEHVSADYNIRRAVQEAAVEPEGRSRTLVRGDTMGRAS
jgi:hypothetical protein